MTVRSRCWLILLLTVISNACRKHDHAMERTERAQSSDSSVVSITAVEFYSNALQRPAHYLIAFPPDYTSNPTSRFPVLVLLHGMDGGPTDWIGKGHLAQYLPEHRFLVVMPDGADSYYTNAEFRSRDRYEDLITQDLVKDVSQHYRVLGKREGRGIAGISMGGYGAVKIALRFPDEYAFAAGLSSALDATRRPFAPKRFGQSLRYLRIFGTYGGNARRTNDVFRLAQQAQAAPYMYLACGTSEPLLEANRLFNRLLERRGLAHEYHEVSGVHSWDSWQSELPALLDAADRHLSAPQ
jgi:putative tributyrin esterase